jgi:hypothetical protein
MHNPCLAANICSDYGRLIRPRRNDRHTLARIIHETVSRDREDGCPTWQPQGLESEAYLNSTSQGSRPEDARKDGHIHGRSSRFMNYPG